MTENFEKKTTNTLAEHGKVLAEHGKRFDAIDEKLADHDAKFDRVFSKLLEHDDRFEQIEEKIQNTEDRILTAIDGIAQRLDISETERIATRSTLDRHEKDITKIKKTLKLAN